MADKAWKQRERNGASLFKDCERNALSGGNSKITRADVIRKRDGQIDTTFPLFIEIKLRKKHTAVTLFDQTRELAKREKRIPVVMLAEGGRPGFWIMCRPEDMQQILDEINVPNPEG